MNKRILMVFVVLLFLISYTSAKLTSGEVTGGGDTINNYINQTGGNTTEEMQDAVGSGFIGNLSYNDAGNSFDVNATNLLAWLNGIYLTLIASFGGDVSGTYDNLQLGSDVVGDNELNYTQSTLADFTNDVSFITNATMNKTVSCS